MSDSSNIVAKTPTEKRTAPASPNETLSDEKKTVIMQKDTQKNRSDDESLVRPPVSLDDTVKIVSDSSNIVDKTPTENKTAPEPSNKTLNDEEMIVIIQEDSQKNKSDDESSKRTPEPLGNSLLNHTKRIMSNISKVVAKTSTKNNTAPAPSNETLIDDEKIEIIPEDTQKNKSDEKSSERTPEPLDHTLRIMSDSSNVVVKTPTEKRTAPASSNKTLIDEQKTVIIQKDTQKNRSDESLVRPPVPLDNTVKIVSDLPNIVTKTPTESKTTPAPSNKTLNDEEKIVNIQEDSQKNKSDEESSERTPEPLDHTKKIMTNISKVVAKTPTKNNTAPAPSNETLIDDEKIEINPEDTQKNMSDEGIWERTSEPLDHTAKIKSESSNIIAKLPTENKTAPAPSNKTLNDEEKIVIIQEESQKNKSDDESSERTPEPLDHTKKIMSNIFKVVAKTPTKNNPAPASSNETLINDEKIEIIPEDTQKNKSDEESFERTPDLLDHSVKVLSNSSNATAKTLPEKSTPTAKSNDIFIDKERIIITQEDPQKSKSDDEYSERALEIATNGDIMDILLKEIEHLSTKTQLILDHLLEIKGSMVRLEMTWPPTVPADRFGPIQRFFDSI